MKKCEVLVERVSLTVGKGSVVIVDDKQFELAKSFLKPLDIKKEVKQEEVKEIRDLEEPLEEKEVKSKKTKKK